MLRATDGERPVSLSEWEWRLVAGVPGGASVLDTNPKPFRDLTRRHLSHPADATALSPSGRSLLVAVRWHTGAVTEEPRRRSEGRARDPTTDIDETLTRLHGDRCVQEELDRHL